jgi:hypothetical protein
MYFWAFIGAKAMGPSDDTLKTPKQTDNINLSSF